MMFPLVLYPFSFEAVYCFICGRQRVAVARYRMICLVLAKVTVDGHYPYYRTTCITFGNKEILVVYVMPPHATEISLIEATNTLTHVMP